MVFVFNAKEKLLVVDQDTMSVSDVESIHMVLSIMHDGTTDEDLKESIGIAQGLLVGCEYGPPSKGLREAVHNVVVRYTAVQTLPDQLGVQVYGSSNLAG